MISCYPKELIPIPTGFHDRMTDGGLQPSDLIIIAGDERGRQLALDRATGP